MTKPKIANGNCLNPIARLEKRFEEYKRCHQSATKNCAKVQESHNKSNDALKALLERKSKLSESKIKKKRSATATTTNRKKPKTSQDQSSNGIFETRVETTPNVTLNVHSSEIPDIDWDSFDILNNPNFSMSINEQELEGVLNSCYSQTTQPCSTKTTQNSSDINLTNVCKTSPNIKHDTLFMQNSANTFKNEEKLFPPLFPPPENHTHSVAQQQSVKFEYLSPQNYISSTTCTYNPTVGSNIVPPISNQIDHHQTATFNAHDSSMYTMNLPPSVNATNSLSYQYHNPLPPEPNTSAQYFYQYPDYGTVDHTSNTVDNFQLPAMSTGWYNNSLPVESVKPATCKLTIPQQQQHQFVNTSIAIANYRNNYSQYNQMAQHQDSSQMQYQQMFVNPNNNSTLVNPQSYDPTHSTIANYAMIPQDQPQQYYYMDYSTNGNRTGIVNSQSAGYVNNRNLISQNDPRLINHPSNPLLCRNVYQ